MKYYELTYLISPDLNEEELRVISQRISSFIQDNGGVLGKIENPVRRGLGYLIKNKSAAYLTTLNFYLEPENLPAIEKKIKDEPIILRYIILTKKEKKAAPEPIKKPKRAWVSEKPAAKPKEKIELKEIEKKLEEILGET